MLYFSCDPHPRDKRACLPKISSPHNLTIAFAIVLTNLYENSFWMNKMAEKFKKIANKQLKSYLL
jgi:hypothetical protein